MSEIQQPFCDKRLEIIAEAGCNHCGDIDRALEMVRHAVTCGADTIKFQSFQASQLVNPGEVLDFCKKSQLSYEDHCMIIDECENERIDPLFSAFDLESLEMLLALGMERVKIPSGQIFNHELLARAAHTMEKIYVSTGMCCLDDVLKAHHTLTLNGAEPQDITIFQCTTAYPAPYIDANLLVIKRYTEEFKCRIGYSDHTQGWAASVGAVALGATVIEKHFILNPDEKTPDAPVSLSPVEFQMMVNDLRNVSLARGKALKRPSKSEREMFRRKDYGGKNGKSITNNPTGT
ncbi:MAG: N-acetylneuraminate synthase family protein [Planctomycetota bacterium]|jgi:N,N'-diacetyllegionaminate synthase